MRELVGIGAVTVERRRADGVSQTNRYHLRTHHPHACGTASVPPGDGEGDGVDAAVRAGHGRSAAATTAPEGAARVLLGRGGGRRDAASPPSGGGLSGSVVPGAAAGCRPVPDVPVGGGRMDAATGRPVRRGWPQGCGPTQSS